MAKFKEAQYVEIAVNHFKGLVNYRLQSGKVVDVICKEYAIECDFLYKWGEAIGQALVYGYESKRRPCILFIYDSPKDWLLLSTIIPVCKKHLITVYTIDILTRQICLRLE